MCVAAVMAQNHKRSNQINCAILLLYYSLQSNIIVLKWNWNDTVSEIYLVAEEKVLFPSSFGWLKKQLEWRRSSISLIISLTEWRRREWRAGGSSLLAEQLLDDGDSHWLERANRMESVSAGLLSTVSRESQHWMHLKAPLALQSHRVSMLKQLLSLPSSSRFQQAGACCVTKQGAWPKPSWPNEPTSSSLTVSEALGFISHPEAWDSSSVNSHYLNPAKDTHYDYTSLSYTDTVQLHNCSGS